MQMNLEKNIFQTQKIKSISSLFAMHSLKSTSTKRSLVIEVVSILLPNEESSCSSYLFNSAESIVLNERFPKLVESFSETAES